MGDKPIVLDRNLPCKGRCGNRITRHRVVVYKDMDYITCEICQHKEVVRYDAGIQPPSGIPWDDAERIRRNLMGVVGDMQTRRWSKGMGDKDKSFLQRVVERLIGIGKDLEKPEDDDG